PWLTSTRSADNCSQLVRGTCCDRSREPQMPAATCEQPTTRREVAFKPDGRRLHLKQSLRLKLCRASLVPAASRMTVVERVAIAGTPLLFGYLKRSRVLVLISKNFINSADRTT